jgi:transposase
MNLFDLLKDHVAMSQEEAESYFAIENTATEWTLKPIRYLEMDTFREVLRFTKEYGGTYDNKPGARCFHIPKEPSNPGSDQKVEGVPMASGPVPDSEQYALSKSLKGKLGQLVPCLEDAEGRIFDGIHRKAIDPKAWTVKLDKVKTPVDRALARMTVNFCRRHYTSEEMRNDIGLLVGSGLSVEEIVETTGISKSTIYIYMPQEAKDEKLSEAQKKGHEQKRGFPALETTLTTQDTAQPEISQRIQTETLNETVECASCKMGVHISKATLIDDKYYCPQHVPKVKPAAKVEPTPFKPKETGDYRVAQMHPKVSKMDTAMLVRLQNNEEIRKLGWHIEFQKPRTKVICISDVTLIDRSGKEIDVYFDFVETHKNSQVEDDFRRQEAARIHKVEVIPLLYDAITETEERRLEKAIVEQLKIRGVP